MLVRYESRAAFIASLQRAGVARPLAHARKVRESAGGWVPDQPGRERGARSRHVKGSYYRAMGEVTRLDPRTLKPIE